MRTLLTILLFAINGITLAQDWTLLNPAYRYNYSKDGTDTISNQIRVMDVDTLGWDSIRYTLNLIGVVCDTCPASLGGPCDGCFVWVDQPQFLGYSCMRVGEDWHFHGRDTFLLRTDAVVGENWQWDSNGATMATIDAQWEQNVLGVTDSLRRILLSDGDTILLSRSLGIIRFPHPSGRYDLIGVEGAGVGRLFPDLLSYFDYEVGDEVIYNITYTCLISPPGGVQYPGTCHYVRKIRITNRVDHSDSVVYSTSVATGTLSPNNGIGSSAVPQWNLPGATWVFSREGVASDHPILSAYPGQVLDTTFCHDNWFSNTAYVARHGITPDGRTRIHADWNGTSTTPEYYGIRTNISITPDLHPVSTIAYVWIDYEEHLGLKLVGRVIAPSASMVTLIGAILSGDTIIPPPTINWTVGIEESFRSGFLLQPNPADHTCFISGQNGGERVSVFDLEGRMVFTTQLAREPAALDIGGLAAGTYVVNVEGMRPQRLIIAR